LDFTPQSDTTASITGNGPEITITDFNNAAGGLTFIGGGNFDAINIIGSVGADSIIATQNEGVTATSVGMNSWVPIDFSAVEGVTIVGGGGNDVLMVDNSAGAVLPNLTGIFYDGGVGNDTLVLQGTTTVTSNIYSVGPDNSSGSSVQVSAGGTQTVFFTGLEPVIDTVAGPLTVNATAADNAITYSELGANGLIAIDNFETIEFANKTNVTIEAGDGDDVATLAASSNGFSGTMTVNSGSGSDTVRYEGTAGADAFVYTPSNTNADAGLVAVNGDKNFTGTEALVIMGQGGADSLTANEPVAGNNDSVVFTPGAGDDGGLRFNSSSPVSFTSIETRTIATGTGSDALSVTGTSGNDTVAIVGGAGSTSLTINGEVTTYTHDTTAGDSISIDTGDGDDAVTVTPGSGITINVDGNNPSASDVLTFLGQGGAITLDLASSTISEAGMGPVSFTGIENLTLDAGNAALTINNTTGVDAVTVRPTSANSATMSVTSNPTQFNLTNVATLTVAGLAGDDDLTVNGTSAGETIAVTDALVTVGGLLTVNHMGFDALTVNGEEGDDTFDVTASATLPIFINGGDPIGSMPGDTLNVSSGGTVTFDQGPENDEGTVTVTTNQPVSFDKIESLTIVGNGTNNATVNGTNGDDDITIIGNTVPATAPGADGSAANDFTVSVNGGLAVQFVDFAGLTVNAMSGDDDIDVETNMLDLIDDVTLNGDLPGASGGDTVTVRGDTGADAFSWTPSGADSGVVSVSGETINVNSAEALFFDGESDNEAITVNGGTGANIFVHTPGGSVDAGGIAITSNGTGQLGLSYVNLGANGSVTVDGMGNIDQLVVQGTGGDDTLHMDTTDISLTTSLGEHVPLVPINIEGVTLAGLEGDDLFNIEPNIVIPLLIQGGGPGGSDVLLIDESAIGRGAGLTNASFNVQPDFTNQQDDAGEVQETTTGFSAFYAGIELVQLLTSFLDDDLRIADDLAGNTWTLQTGPAIQVESGRVQIDSRTPILFENFASVTLENIGGVDRFEVFPDRLPAATIYLVDGFESGVGTDRDTVAFYGTGAGDIAIVTDTDVTIGVSVGYIDFELLEVNTVGGDDILLVDASVAAVSTSLTYDGGSGSDLLRLTGAAGTFTATTYSPGPELTEGRLEYAGATPMSVDFVNLEPVQDSIPTATVTINGTGADNRITLTEGPSSNNALHPFFAGDVTGFVEVDGFESYEFSGKTNLVLNGGAGADQFVINSNATPTSLTGTVTVNGGQPSTGDQLEINGLDTTVAVDFTAGSITGAYGTGGLVQINFATIDGLTALAGASTNLAVSGSADYTVNPGGQSDEGTVLSSGPAITFDGYGAASAIQLDGTGNITVNGTSASDTFNVAATMGHVQIVGRAVVQRTGTATGLVLSGLDGDDTFNLPGPQPYASITLEGGTPDQSDIANLTGDGTGPITVTLSDTATVAGGGLGLVSLPGIEHTNLNAATANVDVNANAVDDDISFTTTGAESGLLTRAGLNNEFGLSQVGNLAVDGLAGDDTLTVNGTTAVNAFTINGTQILIATMQGIDSYAGFAAVTANGLEGSDTFSVTASGVAVQVNGGDPTGVLPGDALNINDPVGEAIVFTPGPEADSGSFLVGANAVISFDEIESSSITGAGAGGGSTVTVNGTNADDDITTVGTGLNDFNVSVNAGPAIQFNGVDGLTINGLSGDDEINFDLNGLNMVNDVTVDSGQPGASKGDTVTVRGGAAADNPTYTPGVPFAGTLALNAGETLNLTNTENLVYHGEAQDETLTVNGSGTFVHTPGSDLDAGDIAINNGSDVLLGISYIHLGLGGSLVLNGLGGDDTLIANGTGSDDAFDVNATTGNVDLARTAGNHLELQPTGIENLVLDGLGGNDDMVVNLPQPYSMITARGGGPGNSDVLTINHEAGALDTFFVSPSATPGEGNVIAGFASVDYIGVEHLQLIGSSVDEDTLSVFEAGGDELWTVTSGPNIGGGTTDRIQIEGRESIDYQTFDTVDLNNFTGDDIFRIHPTTLSNFVTQFTVLGDLDDTLELVGTNNNDTFTQTAPTQFTTNGVAIDFGGGSISTIRLLGDDGDDSFTVDLSTLDAGVQRVVVDGGLPTASDVVNLTVTAAGVVTQGADAQAGVAIDVADGQELHFNGLENLNIDTAGTGSLTVRGTDDNDTVAARPVAAPQGRVWINDGTIITFNSAGGGFNLLQLDGRFGDDNFSVSPIDGVPINVVGGDPSASDQLTVNGTTAANAVTITPTATDGGTVQVDALGLVTFSTTESVTFTGDGGNDLVTIMAPASSTTDYTPGATVDSARVRVNSLVPISLTDLGAGGQDVQIAAAGAGTVVYHGTTLEDVFVVSAGTPATDGRLLLNGQLPVETSGVTSIVLDGKEGDDHFTVNTAQPYTNITLSGGDPDASDSATLNADGTPITITVGAPATVMGGGLGTVTLPGIEDVTLNAANANVDVDGTAADDDIAYTPTGPESGHLARGGLNTEFNLNDVALLDIDGMGGDNTLTVNGTAGLNTFTIDGSMVLVAGLQGVDSYSNESALTVRGLQGSDIFNVTSALIPIFVVGGDPVSADPGDALNLSVGAGEQVTFSPGPEADSGSFVVAANAPVSYDEIESSSVTGAGMGNNSSVLIRGTNADNDINIVGTAANDFTVSIDGSPAVQYIGIDDLTVNGMAGDDDIDIDVNDLALDTTTVIGDNPSEDRDTLTVTGVAGAADNASWTPDMVDGGDFEVGALSGASAIDVQSIERVIYDGEDENEVLTVNGAAASTRFVHTPGAAADAGAFAMTDIGNDDAGLGIEYTNLGLGGSLRVVSGGGADDVLAVRGTASNDAFTLTDNVADDAAIDLVSILGDHVDLITVAIEGLVLDGLDGDDDFTIDMSNIELLFTGGVQIWGGNPSASDHVTINGTTADDTITLSLGQAGDTVVGVVAGPVTLVGVEHLLVASADGNDTLNIDGFGALTDLNDVTLDTGGSANDVINVTGTANPDDIQVTPTSPTRVTATANDQGPLLIGLLDTAAASLFTVDGAGNLDKVTVHGSAANDAIAVVRSTGGNTTVTVDPGTPWKTIDLLENAANTLTVAAGDGVDAVSVTGVGGPVLSVDGGDATNSQPGAGDTLAVTLGDGTTVVSPGATSDAGLVQGPESVAGSEDDVNFVGIEGVSLTGNGAASTVQVDGTHDNDTINALNNGANRVWVNDRAVVTFANYATLHLNARNGDDMVSVTPDQLGIAGGVTAINVTGGSPTASDALIVNGTTGDDANISFVPSGAEAGSVDIDSTSATVPVVTFTTTESVVINGQGGDDDISVDTTSGSARVTVTPGATVDSGDVRVDSLVPMSFTNLGADGTLTIDDTGAGVDEVVYVGTNGSDTFGVLGIETITLNDQIDVHTVGVETYTLQGKGGDDTFDITPVVGVEINTQGDGPGNGSDRLIYTAQISGLNPPVFVDLGNAQIRQMGFGDVNYSGIETIDANASDNVLTVQGTGADDRLEVTPFGGNSGTLQNNGVAPRVNYSGADNNTVTVDAMAGEDTIIVNGTSADDDVDVDVAGLTINTGMFGGSVVFNLTNEALEVNGLAGDDNFDVTPGLIPVFVDGGGPIGLTGDVIDIVAGSNDVTLFTGPEVDEGSLAVGANELVSYDHIEGLTIDFDDTTPGGLTVVGTNGDDDITIVGDDDLLNLTSNNDFTVSVNAGPTVRVTDADSLLVQSLAGDDDIDIEINDLDLAGHVTIEGGLPAIGGDTVTIRGDLDIVDNAAWIPSEVDGGTFVAADERIIMTAIEALAYDGENDSKTFIVFGDGTATSTPDTFTHTPGASRDAGSVGIDNGSGALLGIDYANIGFVGRVIIDGFGLSGNNSLVVLGTPSSDLIEIDFTADDAIVVDLTSTLGKHVTVTTVNVQNYVINALAGDDDIEIAPSTAAPGTVLVQADLFRVLGGGPGAGSDTLTLTGVTGTVENVIVRQAAQPDDQVVEGLGADIDATGIELIRFTGVATDPDTLTVQLGAGDNTARVQAGQAGVWDQVTSDSLPQIDFRGLDAFTVDATTNGGSDVVTFKTWNLLGASAANYRLTGGGTDTLVIEGTDGAGVGNDRFFVTDPDGAGTTSVRIEDTRGSNTTGVATNVVVTETSGGLGRLQINTLGGDDWVTVDASGADGTISVPITFDGGSNSDLLRVTSDAASAIDEAIYSPGPGVLDGRLTYENAANATLMTIDFTGLEPIQDNTVAATLTINGTNASNAINYTAGAGGGLFTGSTGFVSIDSLESIEFNNKLTLTINGGSGDDVINLNNSTTPGALTAITVNAGDPTDSDTLIMNADAATADTLTLVPMAQGAGTIVTSSSNIVDVAFTGVEDLSLVGQLNNVGGGPSFDTFGVDGTSGDDVFEYFVGDTIDSGTVLGTMNLTGAAFGLPTINFTGMHPAQTRTFNTQGNQGGNDAFRFVATSARDTLTYNDGSANPGQLLHAVEGVSVGVLQLGSSNATPPGSTTEVLLQGQGGGDTFNIWADNTVAVVADGGQPDSGSDVLNFFAQGAATLNLGDADIDDAATLSNPDVLYAGIETINLDAGTLTPTIVATTGDDDITVTVGDANSGSVVQGFNVQQAGQVASNPLAPVVNYSNTAGNAVAINLDDGQDTLIVVGNTGAQTFGVNVGTSTITVDDAANGLGNDGTVTYTNNESLAIFGLEGDDTIDVVSGTIPVFIDGGDPVAASDTLNLTAETTSMFSPGPEGDEGGFVLDGNATVSYDHIESISVTDPTGNDLVATVMGTQGADDITAQGQAANAVDVTVNDGPRVSYIGLGTLNLLGKWGDDNISVDVNVAALSVIINVDGNLPTAGSDALRVTGVNGPDDTPSWTPDGAGSGVFALNGQSPINVTGIETLIYDGEADNETLTVVGGTTDDTFVHTPGSARDAGNVSVDNGTATLLGISYEDLGLTGGIAVDGAAGSDTLGVLGTAASDLLEVSFTGTDAIDVDLTSSLGNHIDLTSSAVENYEIDGLDGDDNIEISRTGGTPLIDASGTFDVLGGANGSGSDTLFLLGVADTVENVLVIPQSANPDDQIIGGLGTQIDVNGIEVIRYAGADANDTLTVNPGDGDNDVRVEAADPNGWDGVSSDSLPTIEFVALQNFVVDVSGQGSDVVTFKTWFLQGALPGNYQMVGNGVDTLVIEGTDGAGGGNDSYTVTNAMTATIAGPLAVTDANGSGVTVTATGTMQGRLQINTLGGNDVVTVDESGGLIVPLIGYDGGTGSDVLNVTGSTVVTDAIYSPGPALTAGSLSYDNTMFIDFVNLEPVNDDVPAANLTVVGTNDDDAINYTAGFGGGIFVGLTGLVSVGGFETIEFNNKTSLILNGNAGDDVVSLNNGTTPAGLTGITVNGGDPSASDTLVLNDLDASNTVTIATATNTDRKSVV
jgi:hypothetical protein